MSIQNVTSLSDWNAQLATTKQFGGKSMVVDFTATWCGPCKAMAPIFEQLSTQYPSVAFIKVDVDECADLATKAGVKAMPTFQTYFGGEMLEELVGGDKNKLKLMVEKAAERASNTGGRTLGGGESSGAAGVAAAAAPADDSPEARRARALAAVEARLKA